MGDGYDVVRGKLGEKSAEKYECDYVIIRGVADDGCKSYFSFFFRACQAKKKKERKSNKKWKRNEAISYLYHGVFEASIIKSRHGFLKNILKPPNEANA